MTQEFRDTLRALVEDGVAQHGLRGLARAVQMDMGPIRSIRDPERDVSLSSALKVLDGLGYKVHIVRNSRHAEIAHFAEEAAKMTTAAIDGSPEALKMGFLPIPYDPIMGTMRGAAPIAVARSWIDERKLNPDKLRWIIAPDDAMFPVVEAGALCLLSLQSRHSESGVTAFRHKGELLLSNASRPGGDDWLLDRLDPNFKALYVPRAEAHATLPIGRIAATFKIVLPVTGD